MALGIDDDYQLPKSRIDLLRREDDVLHPVGVRDRYLQAVVFYDGARYDHLRCLPCFRRRNDQRVRDFVVDGSLQCDEIGQLVLRQ